MLTLFRPATGQVRIKGVTSSTNAILHEWFKSQLTDILADQPLLMPTALEAWGNRLVWESWREGLTVKVTLSPELPRLRLLLIMDNLVGHKNPDWLRWCFSQGILPLYTPLAGSWLNMAESIQRLLKRRALNGTYPRTPDEIIAQQSLHQPLAVPRVLQAGNVDAVLATGSSTQRPVTTPARFAVGQTVRAYVGEVPHHTRLPAYVRGKCGVIERLHGMHVFADANALGHPEQSQWLYTVVFGAANLWDEPVSDVKVSVDAWEPYLESA